MEEVSVEEFLKQENISESAIVITGESTLPTKGLTPVEIESRIKLQAQLQREAAGTRSQLRREEAEVKAQLIKSESQLRREEADAASQRALKEHEAQAELRLKFLSFLIKEAPVYIIGVVFVLALGVLSTMTLLNSASPQENRDWARSTLTIISGAVAGYLFGKGTTASKD
jgi:cation transport ATPase